MASKDPRGSSTFLDALSGSLADHGPSFRDAWGASYSSDAAFTSYVETKLLPAVAARLGLEHALTKNAPRGFARIDSVFWRGRDQGRPTSNEDERCIVAIEHENAPHSEGGLESELFHLLRLQAPLRVLWTYSVGGISRATIVEEVQRLAAAMTGEASWRRPLVLVLGERRWEKRQLVWCRLVAATLESSRTVDPVWRTVWSDGRSST